MRNNLFLAVAVAFATLTAPSAHAIDAEQLRQDLIRAVVEGTEGTLTIKDSSQRGADLTLRGVVGSWTSKNSQGDPIHVVISTDAIHLERPNRNGDLLKARTARLTNVTARFGFAMVTVPQLDVRNFTIPLGDAALNRLSWSSDFRYNALESADIRIGIGEAWTGTIAKVRIVNEEFIGNLPTRSYVRIDDMNMPMPTDNDSNPLRQLGYEAISTDVVLRTRLDPAAETLAIEEMTYDIEDVGRISMSLHVGQYDVAQIQRAAASIGAGGTGDPSQLLGAMMAITIDGWEFSFEDQSIVGRVLDREADKRGISRTKLTDQLAGMLPFLLSQIGHPDFERRAREAATSFLKDPGRIALRSQPEHPIGILQIAMAAQSAPATLVDLLSLAIEASPTH